jgi:hypothetical protein
VDGGAGGGGEVEGMRRISFVFLLLCITGSVYAQWSVFFGFGAEANGNTYDGAAAGGVYCMGIDFNRYAVGIKTTISYDFETMSVMEQAGLFRYYLPLKNRAFLYRQKPAAVCYLKTEKALWYFPVVLQRGGE